MLSTTRYRRGDIVLVPFPFTDLSSSKRRPALVISPDAFNDQDIVVAAITSQLAEQQHSLAILQHDCVDGMLPKPSLVKLTKIFTIHSTLIVKKLCAIRQEKLTAVLDELRLFFSYAMRRLASTLGQTVTTTFDPNTGSTIRARSRIDLRRV